MTAALRAALVALRHLRDVLVLVQDDGSPRTAKALRAWMKSAQRLAGLEATSHIDSAADAIVIYGTKGEILRANAAAKRLLPYSEPEWRLPMAERLALGRFRDEHGRQIRPEGTAMLRAVRGEPVSGEIVRAEAPSGEVRWFAVSTRRKAAR